MIFNVLTLFPEMFDISKHSILGKAQDAEKVVINTINIRDYSNSKHHKVDAYPYGGGAGMVMQIQPIADAVKALQTEGKVIYLTPKGKTFTQEMACDLSKETEITLICGHYEGVDQRAIDAFVTDEISIGDYVLTGGEIPAMILIDAIARLQKGVIGKEISFEDESHYNGLLEYPHYTRPANYEDLMVPEVLLSGHHQNIEEYRLMQSLEITELRRPDMFKLWCKRDLSKYERKVLKKHIDKRNKK